AEGDADAVRGAAASGSVRQRHAEEHDDQRRTGNRDLLCLLHHQLERIAAGATLCLDELAQLRVAHLLRLARDCEQLLRLVVEATHTGGAEAPCRLGLRARVAPQEAAADRPAAVGGETGVLGGQVYVWAVR